MARFQTVGCSRRGARLITVALLSVVVAPAGICRGTLVDFEDLSLPANSYWNGSDDSGGFTSQGAAFNNDFTNWGNGVISWSGWAYSNCTDTTTAGYTNQYAAYTGVGYGGAGNYAVACWPTYGGAVPTIAIPTGQQVESLKVTNTTYAALSMLNGDDFAKKFESGDWFKLTITGRDSAGSSIGTIDFYLANGTSIVSDWESVDLGSLAAARTLQFDLTSSDNKYGYMNTPGYFALDNVALTAVPEPSALALLAGGLVAAIARFCRRRRKSTAGHF